MKNKRRHVCRAVLKKREVSTLNTRQPPLLTFPLFFFSFFIFYFEVFLFLFLPNSFGLSFKYTI